MKQKYDTSTIPGYAEMSLEEKVKVLEGLEYDDHSEEITNLKNAVSKANSEAADWKKKHNAQLTDDERAKAESDNEIAELKRKLEEYDHRDKVNSYKAEYLALGYSAELAEKTAEAAANGDMTSVFAFQKKALAEHDAKFKSELMGDITPPPAGTGKNANVDLSKQIAEAQEAGNMAQVAALIRQQQMAEAEKNKT